MPESHPLSEAFLAHVPRERLAELVRQAHEAWPDVTLDEAAYVAFLAARIPADQELPAALDRLQTSDLYLACACSRGDAAAMRAFEDAFFRDAESVLRRTSTDRAFVEEILQMLRAKLFVAPDASSPPRIVEYAGRGDLRSWFRVVATREAVSALRRTSREVATPDPMLDLAAGKNADPELSYLLSRHAAEFQKAFVDASRGLTSEERNLLRYHYVDSLSIDHIGAIYRVHRVTASRRLNKAREKLIGATRALLAERLALSATELESVLRLLQSDVDISIRRVLGEASVSHR